MEGGKSSHESTVKKKGQTGLFWGFSGRGNIRSDGRENNKWEKGGRQE